MKMEQTECCIMSAHKIQMAGNHPKERIQHGTTCLSPVITTQNGKVKLHVILECIQFLLKGQLVPLDVKFTFGGVKFKFYENCLV